jgi:hypothetical protein
MNLPLRTWVTLSLAGVIAMLIGLFLWQTNWGRELKPRVDPPRVAAGATRSADLLPRHKIEFDDPTTHRNVLERPLFTPTRALAPPPPPPAPNVPTMQRGKYQLTGAIVAGDVKAAYLREVASGRSHTIRQGDQLPDGYRVELVEARRVTLRFNEDTEQIEVQSGPARPGGLPGVGGAGAVATTYVPPASPYTTTIDRPAILGGANVAGLPPGVYPPGVTPPQGVPTGTPGFPVPQGASPPAVPGLTPAPQAAVPVPAVPPATNPAAPAAAGDPNNPPPRRRMWQNAQ